MNTNPANGQCPRLKLAVRGVVQGVGFRPFVHRLATELGLTGWVNNSAQGVFIEVEGRRMALDQFLLRLETEKPPRSFIQSKEAIWLAAGGYPNFEIRASEPGGAKTALILPDLATCPACRREISDPTNRRHQYPFTNCTHCGPRFSIIEALPYDRANTTMRRFRMCPACQAEYDNPCDRRFHAQPNACPVCGPQLELWPGHPSNSCSATRTNHRADSHMDTTPCCPPPMSSAAARSSPSKALAAFICWWTPAMAPPSAGCANASSARKNRSP
ncbi:MAG: acylphosphatase [Verrucomicrobiota bacterium]